MLKRLNFSFEFFEKNAIFPFYESVHNKTNSKIVLNKNLENYENYLNDLCIVQYIPPYFDLKLNEEKSSFNFHEISTYQGFRADFDGFNTVEEYMSAQLSKGVKKTIKSRLKRLEDCFNITYEMYYGFIAKEKYDFLFDGLESMINRRFDQRNEEHSGLKKWAYYKEIAYQMIVDKKAAFFVILDGEKPIVIGLNFLYQNIFDSAITSYDIDYAKFGLGNIAVFKKMEWCFNNGFRRYDMRWGDLAYKRIWCNVTDQYKCHILYNKKKLSRRIIASVVVFIMNIKTYLRLKNILPIKSKIKTILKNNFKLNEPITSIDDPKFEVIDLNEKKFVSNYTIIDTDKDEYSFLRKEKYDFQYINFEHSNNLKVLKIDNSENSYLILGANKRLQLNRLK